MSDFIGVFVYINGQALEDNEEGIIFKSRNRSDEAVLIPVTRGLSYKEFIDTIIGELNIGVSKRVKRMRYRCPYKIDSSGKITYRSVTLAGDGHIQLMYDYNDRYRGSISGIEICVEIEQYEGAECSWNPAIRDGGIGDRRNDLNYTNILSERATVECFGYCEDSDEDPDGIGCDVGPQHVPPPFMHMLDLEAMKVPEFPGYTPAVTEYEYGGELEIGMQFENKDAADHAIRQYNMSRSKTYKTKESTPVTIRCVCINFDSGCNWLVRVSYIKKDDAWVLKRYNGPHTCMGLDFTQDHPKLSSDMISEWIKDLVREDITIKIRIIMATVQSKVGYACSYRKAWMAKQKAIEKVYGSWVGSYAHLPTWLGAMFTFDRGTQVQLETVTIFEKNGVEKQHERQFHRLFWAFRSCIKGFLHCKPIVQVDGTHLYGKYRGTLLVAVSQDGNQNVLPIGFAIVEGETAEAWSFFLTQLRIHVVRQRVVGLISDRHKSIIAAVNQCNDKWTPPKAHHRFCLRHIAANFLREYKKPNLHKLVITLGYARTEREFNKYYQQMQRHGQIYTNWLDGIGERYLWAQAFDGGYRCGHMTTNLVECINSMLKGVRHLPIAALVEATYYRLNNLFVTKSSEASAQKATGKMFSNFLESQMEQNIIEASRFNVITFDRFQDSFEVKDRHRDRRFVVNIHQKYCDCGDFQIDGYPCRHVVACCQHVGVNWQLHVDLVYHIDEICKVYARSFKPIGHEDNWPIYNGPLIVPNPNRLRDGKGRPKSTRFLNEMDGPEMRRQNRCGICKQQGHRRVKCPNR